MDKRDIARIRNFPSVGVPYFSELEKPENFGERVLVAKNGVFLEIYRKWGYFIRKVGEFSVDTPLPYGELCNHTQLSFDNLPRHLLQEFNELARQENHVEIGASIVWHENSGAFRLMRSKSLMAGRGHLKFERPNLSDGEHLIVDCHSHSSYPAFFSPDDDEDDQHVSWFAYVVGNNDQPVQSMALRLCLKGIFERLPTPILY